MLRRKGVLARIIVRIPPRNGSYATRIASREILPAGKILALISSPHWDVGRKVSACFILLLVFPNGLFLLHSRVRYLMRGVWEDARRGGFRKNIPRKRVPLLWSGRGGILRVLTSCSVISQKTGAIHLLVFSPSPAFMNDCC